MRGAWLSQFENQRLIYRDTETRTGERRRGSPEIGENWLRESCLLSAAVNWQTIEIEWFISS
jgi:hypothetical protein